MTGEDERAGGSRAESVRSPWTRYPVFMTVAGKALGLALIPFFPVAGLLVYYFSGSFLAFNLLVPSAQGLGPVVTRFETPRREVWLTIDDGPDPADTPRRLEVLEKHGAKAAFFVIGERAAAHPDLIAAIRAAGHAVGHHTHTHPCFSFWSLTPALLRDELVRGLDALRVAGVTPEYFRPPVGIKNAGLNRELERLGMRHVAWSVRSGDSYAKSPEAVVARVMRKVTPGAILLMHEGPSLPARLRVEAIDRVLGKLGEAGYRCVLPPASALR